MHGSDFLSFPDELLMLYTLVDADSSRGGVNIRTLKVVFSWNTVNTPYLQNQYFELQWRRIGVKSTPTQEFFFHAMLVAIRACMRAQPLNLI
jgi:hypothetical protein